MDAFSQVLNLDHDAASGTKKRFCDLIVALLYFRQMPDRAENVPEAHKNTFECIFTERKEAETSSQAKSFPEWLRCDDESIYWTTGKPGAGKSTLMKYLRDESRVSALL